MPVILQAMHAVSTRLSANPTSKHSHCPRVKIESGSTASIARVCPLNRRASRMAEAAAAESSPAFKYSPARKSGMARRSMTCISLGMTFRCSLYCVVTH